MLAASGAQITFAEHVGFKVPFGPINFKYQSGTAPPLTLLEMAIAPSSLTGGASTTGRVTLSANAPTGGVTVPLTKSPSSTSAVTIPASVFVAGGSSTQTFPISTSAVSSPVAVSVSGSYGGGPTRTASLTVNPAGGSAGGGTPFFISPLPLGSYTAVSNWDGWVGTRVRNTGTASVIVKELGRMKLPGNSGSHQVAIFTAFQGAPAVTATVNLATGTVNEFVYATIPDFPLLPGLSYWIASRETPGGDIWYRTTSGVAPANTGVVTVDASIESWVDASGGANEFAPFWQIFLPFGPVNFKHGNGTPAGPSLSAISLVQNSVTGGATVAGTVTLSGPAPAGGAAVSFSSNGTAATAATVNVAPGQTSAPLVVSTTTVGSAATVRITGSYGGQTRYVDLTVNPAAGGTPPVAFFTYLPTASDTISNYSGWAGMRIRVPAGGPAVTVKQLGRKKLAGNGPSRQMAIFAAGAVGAPIPNSPIATAVVDLSAAAVGQFAYANVTNPSNGSDSVQLLAGQDYFVVSKEVNGEAFWFKVWGNDIATTGVATVIGDVIGSDGAQITFGEDGYRAPFGPVDFKHVP